VRLFHFTCDHGRRGIGSGTCLLLPQLHPWLGKKLVWLTTQAYPDRHATGLTSRYITCDRMRWRYVVTDSAACRAWLSSLERAMLDPARVRDFEVQDDGTPAAPEQWWISDRPVHAQLDRAYQRSAA
jgi:hypothetical protein